MGFSPYIADCVVICCLQTTEKLLETILVVVIGTLSHNYN